MCGGRVDVYSREGGMELGCCACSPQRRKARQRTHETAGVFRTRTARRLQDERLCRTAARHGGRRWVPKSETHSRRVGFCSNGTGRSSPPTHPATKVEVHDRYIWSTWATRGQFGDPGRPTSPPNRGVRFATARAHSEKRPKIALRQFPTMGLPRAFACGPGLAIRDDIPSFHREGNKEVNFPRDLQSRAGAVHNRTQNLI